MAAMEVEPFLPPPTLGLVSSTVAEPQQQRDTRFITVRQILAACPDILNLKPSPKYVQPFLVEGLTETVPNPKVKRMESLKEATLNRLSILTSAQRTNTYLSPILGMYPLRDEFADLQQCAAPGLSLFQSEMALYFHVYLETDDVDREAHATRSMRLLLSVYDRVLGVDSPFLQSLRLTGTNALQELRDQELRRLQPRGGGGGYREHTINPATLPVTVNEAFELFQELVGLTLRRSMRRLGPLLARPREELLVLEREEESRIRSLTHRFQTQLGHPLMHQWWLEYQRLAELHHPEARPPLTEVDPDAEDEEEKVLRRRWAKTLATIYPDREGTAPGEAQVGSHAWTQLFNFTKRESELAARDKENWWVVAMTDEYLQSRYERYLELTALAVRAREQEKDLLFGLESLDTKRRAAGNNPPSELALSELAQAWVDRFTEILADQVNHFRSYLEEQYSIVRSRNVGRNGFDVIPQLQELPEELRQSQLRFLLQLVSIPDLLPGLEDEEGDIFTERWEEHLVRVTADLYRNRALPYLPGLRTPDEEPEELVVKDATEEARNALIWFLNWDRLHEQLLKCWSWHLRGNSPQDPASAAAYHNLQVKQAKAVAGELTRHIRCAGETIEIPAVYEKYSGDNSPVRLTVTVKRRPGPEWSSPKVRGPYEYSWSFSPDLGDIASGEQVAVSGVDEAVSDLDRANQDGVLSTGPIWRPMLIHTSTSNTNTLTLNPPDTGFDISYRGSYRCTVSAYVQEQEGEEYRLAKAYSTVATLVIKHHCVRCNTWFEPGKSRNHFGDCRWNAPLFQSESRMLAGDYRGMLATELEEKLEELQTNLEYSQHRLLYQTTEHPIQEENYQEETLREIEKVKEQLDYVSNLPKFLSPEEDASYQGFLSRLKVALLHAQAELEAVGPQLSYLLGLPKGTHNVVDAFLAAYPTFLPTADLIPEVKSLVPRTDLQQQWQEWARSMEGENPILLFAKSLHVLPYSGEYTETTLDVILRQQPDLSLLEHAKDAAQQLPVYAVIQLALFPPVKRHLISYDVHFAQYLRSLLHKLSNKLECVSTPIPQPYLASRVSKTWGSVSLFLTHNAARMAMATPADLVGLANELDIPSTELLHDKALLKKVKQEQGIAEAKQAARTASELPRVYEYPSKAQTNDLQKMQIQDFLRKRSSTILLWKDKHSSTNPYPTPWDVVSGVRGSLPCCLLPERDEAKALNDEIIKLRREWLRNHLSRKVGISQEDKDRLLRKAEQQRVRLLDDEDLKDSSLFRSKLLALRFNRLQRKLLRET